MIMCSTMIETYIEVPFSFYFKHCYKHAPDQVKFLREEHPHDFDCLVTIEVLHNDRELEFYIVREFLNSKIVSIKRRTAKKASCEMISDVIFSILQKEYGRDRKIMIRVKEDNKYGSFKVYTPKEADMVVRRKNNAQDNH